MTFREPSAAQHRFGYAILAIFLFLIGIWFTLPPMQLPGDLGDTRFNLYVLEHGYRWLVGMEPSFWDAPFFYPAENTLAYSDSHLGTFFIYAFFRMLDFGTYDALYGWLFVCTSLNYIAALWVSRNLGVFGVGGTLAAFIFTFGLPVSGLVGHVQIVPRFWVPIAFLMAYRLLTGGSYKYVYFLALAAVAQLYASIYTGYFLALCLIGFFAYFFVAGDRQHLAKLLSVQGCKHIVLAATTGALLLLPLAVPHYLASQAVGGRGWHEISTMLPRILSYFRSPHSEIWSSVLPSSGSLPMAHEHPLFFGMVPIVFLAIFTLRMKRLSWDKQAGAVGKAMLSSFVIVFVITLSVNGFSVYRLLSGLPGVSGIRAVTRVATVLVFPIGIIVGVVSNHYLSRVRQNFGASFAVVLAGLIVGGVVLDQWPAVPGFSKAQAVMLTDPLRERASSSDKAIIWLSHENAESNAFWKTNLTAMLLSQQLGKRTVNGYSGSLPPGYPGELFTHNSTEPCAALQRWLTVSGHSAIAGNILKLGAENCQLEETRSGLHLGKSFYALEGEPEQKIWAWSRASNAEFFIKMNDFSEAEYRLSFTIGVIAPGTLSVIGPATNYSYSINPGNSVSVSMVLSSDVDLHRIRIESDIDPQVPGNGDPRKLTFNISDWEIESVTSGD